MISPLPSHLQERVRSVQAAAMRGEFILYWMHNAMRSHENPALDVARHLAAENSLPLLVYQGLSERYAYASDRHHTFMLQGARDVQRQFADMGISYAVHVERPGFRDPYLVSLAERAALVVTEDMPVDPPRRFLQSLVARTSTAILAVDTACVVPMKVVGRAFTRAFQYRDHTREHYAERLSRPWPEVGLGFSDRTWDLSTLPFPSIQLESETLAEWVAACQIDHSVGPVVDTVGGSQAGYTRWSRFRDTGLAGYARRRNDALLDGVSRLSAYLHYGMVSPFRIAREANQIDNAGSQKYLDELLIWRELAYAFCFFRPDHDRWTALPDWAQQTLQAHAKDLRSPVWNWEALARGQTEDPLWNAAQRSLLMQGELHNNVRMTWGKRILDWTPTPQAALQMIIDLNHRYALDGRDPASYGGILWCLGQFDRPFQPPQPRLGTVRPRPTAGHAERLDCDAFLAKVTAPRFVPVPRVAIVGAGLSGLFAARTLRDHGLPVTVFEKSRGLGGRMATRRLPDGSSFDHGAQYFTVRDPRFQCYIEAWFQQGLVAAWPDPGASEHQRIVVLRNGQIQSEPGPQPRFVGVPTMNAICKHLGEGLEICKQCRITQVQYQHGRLHLIDDQSNQHGPFDRLVVSAPAEQTAELLADVSVLHQSLSKIQMNPCWAAMASFSKPLTDQWVGAFLHDSHLSWAARNGTKPGRKNDREQLVLHATPDWTAQHWEEDATAVTQSMLEEFWRVSGLPPQPTQHLQGHRWKYAIPSTADEAGCYFDARLGIAACGDWASGSRVEGAFLSGMAAAGRILGTLKAGKQVATQLQTRLFD